jgi:type VI secretion system secreted protein Hcp
MAQADMFIKIDDVQGESTDSTHKNEIEVTSWSWGAAQAGSSHGGTGSGSGKVAVQDLSVTFNVDKSVPTLMNMVMKGTPFKKALLVCRRSGGNPVEYLKITMTSGLLAGLQLGGSPVVTATMALNFSAVQIDYTPQKADGSAGAVVTTQFNIAGNA